MDYLCKFCGHPIPQERVQHALSTGLEPSYCSRDCNSLYRRHGCSQKDYLASLQRVCKYCGEHYTARSLRSDFCSRNCSTYYYLHGRVSKAEWDAAKATRRATRQSVRKPRPKRPPQDPAKVVETLRGSRSGDYFRAVFSLPEHDQLAEISSWTPEDHAAALSLLGFGEDRDGSEDGETLPALAQRAPAPYDEANPGFPDD